MKEQPTVVGIVEINDCGFKRSLQGEQTIRTISIAELSKAPVPRDLESRLIVDTSKVAGVIICK